MAGPRTSSIPLALALAALVVVVLCCVFGGAAFAPDVEVIRGFIEWRGAHAGATPALIAVTTFGSASALLPLTVIAIVAVGWRTRRNVWPFALTVVGGRLAIELIKVLVARPRPSLDAHPVHVFSQSFPSAHAGNSMLLFFAAALWLSTPRWRSLAVGVAVTASVLIGATRPMLGVHWPTDVLGGWSFGIGWTLAFWSLSRRVSRGETAG